MEAHLMRCAFLAAAVASLGASYRTANFVVEAPTPAIAQQLGQAAEACRRDLAIEWLGREMPNWSQPCPITAQVGDHLGAGGATSFVFEHGEVFGWRMTIQGSLVRILDSVLPHEVTHTIFATHFRQPLPRWADEGACTTVEHASERAKQQNMLVDFLRTGRGIAFNRMFAMKEYPRDVMPLYSQGYSLARYLIAQGGRRKFIADLGAGHRRAVVIGAAQKQRQHVGAVFEVRIPARPGDEVVHQAVVPASVSGQPCPRAETLTLHGNPSSSSARAGTSTCQSASPTGASGPATGAPLAASAASPPSSASAAAGTKTAISSPGKKTWPSWRKSAPNRGLLPRRTICGK